MTPQAALADSVLATVPLVARYLKGFDDSNRTRQAPNLPNHAAWCLGHLALTMHRVAEMIDGKPLPADTFAPGAGEARARSGPAPAYFTETLAFGSRPVDDPTLYPALAFCSAAFQSACERLAGAVRAASDTQLDRNVPWGPTGATTTVRALIPRMVYHNGCHAGQIIDLRRALGMGSALS